MVKQAENICRKAALQLRSNETELQNWRALKEQLCNKFILRLVSCVQLASKLSFHYKVRSWVTRGHPRKRLIEGACEKPTAKLGDTTHVEIPECNYAS